MLCHVQNSQCFNWQHHMLFFIQAVGNVADRLDCNEGNEGNRDAYSNYWVWLGKILTKMMIFNTTPDVPKLRALNDPRILNLVMELHSSLPLL